MQFTLTKFSLLTTPVCLSKCFVNKFGVRSTSNIGELRALKTCDIRQFLKLILEDNTIPEQDITSLSCDLSAFLMDLKSNIRNACKTDFKEYFPVFPDSGTSRNLVPVSKSKIADACCLALLNILPSYFFGHPNNIRLFKRQLREIVYSMRGQHIFLSNCIDKWRLECTTWCEPVALDNRRILLYKILLWIYKYVLSAIMVVNFYVTTTECTHDDTILFYFSKSQWQSFQDRSLRSMLAAGTLSVYQQYTCRKRHRKTYSPLQRHWLKQVVKSIPKLYMVLKNAGKFRPIVRYKSQKKRDKKVKERTSLLRLLNGINNPPRDSLEVRYTNLFHKWSELKRPKLYFVRADLTDAFGSIDRKVLVRILSHCHKKYQEKEQNGYLKKKAATEYRTLTSELRSPLLVRCGSTVYEWTNGLVQGLKFSPALSDIYYGYLDQIYFAETLSSCKGQILLFRRVVDDYLYISDSLDNAVRFLHDLTKYDNLNNSKTMTNFICEDMKVSQDITFLGFVYNTTTLEVSRSPDVLQGRACYKTAFTPAVADLVKFIENRIGQSSLPIDAHIFNLHYNSEKSIWVHSFAVFCLAANKFCTILSVLCEQVEITLKYLETYKKEVGVKLCNAIVDTIVRNKPSNVKYYYCINHLRLMAYKALLLCAINTKKCTALVPEIKVLVAKTNCTVGKWRTHASGIGRNGIKTKNAVVEVCKRSDFRMFLRSCDSLPIGFECYNGHLEDNDK